MFHLLFVFSWIGCLLGLTRVLAYSKREPEEIQKSLYRMWKRSYLFIDLPSMLLTIASGVLLVIFFKPDAFKQGYFHLKMTAVVILIICDVTLGFKILRRKKGSFLLHGIAALCLLLILFAIYILKFKAL